MYIVMKNIPPDIIDIDAGVLKFWELKSPARLKGLEICTHDPELGERLTTLTNGVLKAAPIGKHLPNWYEDRVLYIKANHKVYILARTRSVLDL
jgi:hypothetical protein